MNNALLYLGGLLIAALAVLFAAPRFIDWNSYRGVFEEEASRILGREVRVGGAVNLRLLPSPYVSFERLRIADISDEGSSSIIRIENFTMRLSVPPLLKGLIEAHRVEIRRPILNLVINDEGGGNWQSLAASPGTLPFVPKDVTLQSVLIEEGEIVISGPGRRELARFDAINGELTAEALEGPFRYRGSVNWQGKPRHLRLATAQIDANGDLRFKAAVDVADSSNSYMLDGRLSDLRGAPTLDGELIARLALAPGQKGAAADPPAQAQPLPATGTGSPENTAEDEGGDGNAAEFSVDTPVAVPPSSPDGAKRFELKAKIAGTTSHLRLDDIAISLEAGTTPQLISGEARLEWAKRMHFDVKLASRWLDLDQVSGVSEKQTPLEAARSYFEALASALPEESDTNALLEFDQLTLGGQPIGNVRLAARRAGGPLELDAVRADLPGGVRVELDGVLTPSSTAPRLDGALFLSGKSLMRFLAWGLDDPTVGEGRNDGPFALDGKFALGNGALSLTDATFEFSGTPLTGQLKLDLGERRRIEMAVEGPRVNVAQIGSGAVNLMALRAPVMGDSSEGDANGATADSPSAGAFNMDSTDIALDLKVAELVDGALVLNDVDASVALERGALSIPRLKFSTPEGLLVEAVGDAKNLSTVAQGALRGLVAAPNPRAARAFLTLLGGDDGALIQDFDRLTALAPLRLAWRLDLSGGETQSTKLTLDGLLDGGRMSGDLHLDGGRKTWRTAPIDIEARFDSPNIAGLMGTLLGADIADDAAQRAGAGHSVIKAAGIARDGLLTLADVTADGLALNYRGHVRLAAAEGRNLDGELRIRSADARVPLALAGLSVGNGAEGIAMAGTVQVLRTGGALTVKGNRVRLGDSVVSGEVALVSQDGARDRVDATLTADKATVAALLSPITRRAAPLPADAPQIEAETEDAEAAAPPPIWPDRPLDVDPVGRLDGKIDLTVKALALEPGLTISDARVDVELSQDGIKIARLDGGAVGGQLTSSFDLARAPAGVTLDGTVNITIGGAPAKVSSDGANGKARDAVRFTSKFSGRGFSPAAVITSLKGDGALTVADATLNGNSPTAVAAVARAALTGQGPTGGEDFSAAISNALKDGEVPIGELTIPAKIEDGVLKLDRVRVDMADGWSTFATVVELASMQIDSEWQIGPKLDEALAASAQAAPLPAVTVVYTGKLSELDALQPSVSAGALERELVVRKMEYDVGELERLRKLDEERARKDAERRRALEEERARKEAERQRALEEERAREEARRALEEDTQHPYPDGWSPGQGGAPVDRETLPPPPGAEHKSDTLDSSEWDACTSGTDATVAASACERLIASSDLVGRDRAAILYRYGRALRDQGAFDAAIARYGESIALAPTADAFNHRAVAYFGKGDHDNAIRDYGEALRIDPKHAEALNNRAWTYFTARNFAAALADADRAIAIDAGQAYVWDTRGHVHEALGNRHEAIRDYVKALELDADTATSREALNRLGASQSEISSASRPRASSSSVSQRPRRKRPVDEEWRPFQSNPF